MNSETYAQTMPKTTLIPNGANLRVENLWGSIQIVLTTNATLTCTATRANSGLVTAEEILSNNNGSQYTIVTRPKDSTPIDLKIKVPETTNLRIFSELGNIEVLGSPASLWAKTDRGNIQLNLNTQVNADIACSSETGSVRSVRQIKSIGTSNPHFLHGQLGEGGALFMAHSEHGQVLLATLDDPLERTINPPLAKEDSQNRPEPEERKPNLAEEETANNSPLPSATPSRPVLKGADNSPSTPNAPVYETKPNYSNDSDILKIESQLVTTNVSATLANGQLLADLTKADFKIYEDGVQQEIVHFQPVDTPFNLVLLIDLSGSVRDKIDLIRRAAKRFIRATRPEDKVAVVTFTARTRIVSPLTTNHEEVIKRIDKIRKPDGGTNFYDALEDTLRGILAPVHNERNAIILMSDGVDNVLPGVPGEGSVISFEETFEHLQEANTIVYPIYLDTEQEAVEEFGREIVPAYRIARKELQDMADATGGVGFYAQRVEDLEGQYEKVAAQLRLIYSIGYYPNNTEHDGRFHKIKVKINREGAQARNRRGYYAKK